jgi:hypothetical protein
MDNVTPSGHLYRLAQEWEEQSRQGERDPVSYREVLDEILFHAELRFVDYRQFKEDGSFTTRLREWVEQAESRAQQKSLFLLLKWILFIDHWQMRSLYRDAYRRVIVPWVSRAHLSAADLLCEEYEAKLITALKEYRLFSITESFGFNEFLHENSLLGLTKPIVIGERASGVRAVLSKYDSPPGLIIFEDFVGTGKQAGEVLAEIGRLAPSRCEVIFIPLITLKKGLRRLSRIGEKNNILVQPVWVVPDSSCLFEVPSRTEPRDFKRVRATIKQTRRRVIERYTQLDDPPNNPFGYGGSGALLVTCHNTPNNAPPLIHHRAPQWSPLFRRLHHSKEGL